MLQQQIFSDNCNRFSFSEYTAFRRARSALERGEVYAAQTEKQRKYALHIGSGGVCYRPCLSGGVFGEMHTADRRRRADRAGDLPFKAIAILFER